MTLEELKKQRPTPQQYSNLYDEWIDSAIAYAEQLQRERDEAFELANRLSVVLEAIGRGVPTRDFDEAIVRAHSWMDRIEGGQDERD